MEEGRSFHWWPFCCLCLFDFCDGDRVIRSGHPSESGSRAPATVEFDYEILIFNPENPQYISPRQWGRTRTCVLAAHLDCTRRFPPFDKHVVLNLLHHDFPPSDSRKRERMLVLRQYCLDISGEHADITLDALREQARIGVRDLIRGPNLVNILSSKKARYLHFVVDPSKPIWGISTTFENARYLQGLSNKAGKHAFLVVSEPQKFSSGVYLASDHLGVRAISFGETDVTQSCHYEQPGIWWTFQNTNKSERYFLKWYSDGFKMRDLHMVRLQENVLGPLARWSLLPPNPEAIWYLHLGDRSGGRHYFKVLECESPEITGYSACLLDEDLFYLHGHREGEDFSFYSEGRGERLHAVWLYFPVEKHERIVEVWRLRRRPTFWRDILLPNAIFERVALLTAQPSRLWFSSQGDGVDCLAFDCEDKRHDKTEAPPFFHDPSTWSSRVSVQQVFNKSVRLGGVTGLVPCRTWIPGSTGIVGLIFTYSDGSRESVGQVRLDHLLPPIEVDPAGEMWIGARLLQPSGAVVESMRVIPSTGQTFHGGNPSQEGLTWLRILWRGRLDWNFLYSKCFINVSDQANVNQDMNIDMLLESWAGREWEKEQISEQLAVRAR
ncbi:unnamed protein product [Fusarium fujikuroi]|nr:hypothetical protein CEK25_001626 [Fusarium fujikuroi]SCN66312.1 uncharacterized protein FFE2_00394 [Fusarium fujikuroi]SCV26679.1 uncharacterized protein FFFS_00392 [Fusarium fujikuroi]VZH87484.1 unnamed protein product [Fusarium fujikuroi]